MILDGLVVDKNKMAANLAEGNDLALTEAFTLALSKHEGRDGARKIAEALARVAVESGQSLRDVVLKDPQMMKYFTVADIDHIFNPKHFNGSADSIVAAVLAAHASAQATSKSGERKS